MPAALVVVRATKMPSYVCLETQLPTLNHPKSRRVKSKERHPIIVLDIEKMMGKQNNKKVTKVIPQAVSMVKTV